MSTSCIALIEKFVFTGTKKKQLHVDRPDDDALVGTYADVDDYDFM
jgi:hypothetical protein